MTGTPFDKILSPEWIRRDAPLSEYTSMRVGGPADVLLEPGSEEEIAAILRIAQMEQMPLFILGNGSNVLFSDDGFRGAVLRIGKRFSDMQQSGTAIIAQAGALLSAIARLAAANTLSGFEFAAGIPGSLGGAVCMNAGAYGGEMARVIAKARVYAEGDIRTLSREDLDLSYRHSAVMEKGWLVLSAELSLLPGDREKIEADMAELNRRRREKQPLQYPSCGSFFKRPEGYFAGALIEQAGLKGFSVGDAQVSELHAGFLINRGHATAGQFYALMRQVQKTVFEKSGVALEPEVKLIGSFEQ